MLNKIDWLSFTVRFDTGEGESEQTCILKAYDAATTLYPAIMPLLFERWTWNWCKGQKPYSAALRRDDHGVFVHVNPKLDHALFQVTGRGCDELGSDPRALEFLAAIAPRLTRIDIAADMLTDTLPLDFAAERDVKRFRSFGVQHSDSGSTVYIGSRTSNRFARVYRYNPPHDRSHLLRVEVEAKGHDAEYTARAILSDGLPAVVRSMGESFGWKHADWQPDAEDSAILEVWRPERGKGKTVFWLNDTIAPLLVRLHAEGTISALDWFRDEIMPKLANSGTV